MLPSENIPQCHSNASFGLALVVAMERPKSPNIFAKPFRRFFCSIFSWLVGGSYGLLLEVVSTGVKKRTGDARPLKLADLGGG